MVRKAWTTRKINLEANLILDYATANGTAWPEMSGTSPDRRLQMEQIQITDLDLNSGAISTGLPGPGGKSWLSSGGAAPGIVEKRASEFG